VRDPDNDDVGIGNCFLYSGTLHHLEKTIDLQPGMRGEVLNFHALACFRGDGFRIMINEARATMTFAWMGVPE